MMARVQGLALILVTLTLPLVHPSYRFGPLAFYDLAVILLWGIILVFPHPLRRVPRTLVTRLALIFAVVLLGGCVGTLLGQDLLGIEIRVDTLLRILMGVALYTGVWVLIAEEPRQVRLIIGSIFAVAAFQGVMVLLKMSGTVRYQGTFTDPNYFAAFQSVVFVILLVFVLGEKNIWRKVLYFSLLLIIGISILVSYSRGAYLACLFGTLFVFGIHFRRHHLRLILGTLTLTGVIVLIMRYVERLPSYMQWGSDRLSLEVLLKSGWAGRKELWHRAVETILENPLGYGWGADWSLLGNVGHNIVLETAIQFGIIGLAAISIFGVITLLDIHKVYRSTEVSPVIIGFTGAVVVVGISALSLNVLSSRPFWFVLALGGVTASQLPKQLSVLRSIRPTPDSLPPTG